MKQMLGTRQTKHRLINCGPCVCIVVVLISLAVTVAVILAAIAIKASYTHYGTHVYQVSGPLLSAPFGQGLDGKGGILAMTLPDTTDFYDRTFIMTDLHGAAHTFTLPAAVLFDGGFTTATFDGTAGSTIVYRRVTATRVHVISKFGVVLS